MGGQSAKSSAKLAQESCSTAGVISERVYDKSEMGLDAYIRHLTRVPFFRSGQEVPLVYVTGKIQSVLPLLEVYTRLFELTCQFNRARWVAYLGLDHLIEFLDDAETWGDVELVGDQLYRWYTLPSAILITTQHNNSSELHRAVAALDRAPESGIIALAAPASHGLGDSPNSQDAPRGASRILTSGSLARMRFEREHSLMDLPTTREGPRSPSPPSNPRIRRHTG